MSQYVRARKSRSLAAWETLQSLARAFRDPSRVAPELRGFGMRSPRSVLMAAKNFVVTTWDPANSDIRQGINALIGGALQDPRPELIESARKRSPECAALFEERYDPPLDLDRLALLPEGTLGHEYARFIRANGIEPLGSMVEWGEPRNLLQYILLRSYKLHDVLHVVLGCPATPLGEVPIVAFSVGQADTTSKNANAPALALAVVLLHIALRRTNEFAEACRLVGDWTRIGERSRPYPEFRFEAMMDQPVEDVRRRVLVSG